MNLEPKTKNELLRLMSAYTKQSKNLGVIIPNTSTLVGELEIYTRHNEDNKTHLGKLKNSLQNLHQDMSELLKSDDYNYEKSKKIMKKF